MKADNITRVIFDRVSVEFPTEKGPMQVLDQVSFELRQGEFVSIIGPSGCGKSTLMNMLAGFVKPTQGQIRLDGREVTGPGPDRGVIFQEYGVFPWLTVQQNIEFGMRLSISKITPTERTLTAQKYMSLMGLSDFANHFPKHLSGGMRQRLAIARAYAVNPEFLLMDEPFGALDAQTRSAMQDLLLNVLATEKKTVLLITHSVDEAIYLSSRIIVVTARPARIRADITVSFPYPRPANLSDSPAFSELRSQIRDLVMQEYAAQIKQTRLTAD